MDAPLDLYGASRAELADLILAQRDRIAELEQRLVRQEADLAAQRAVLADLSQQVGQALAALTGDDPPPPGTRPPGMPGLKPPTPPRTRAPHKRRARGYGRRRLRPTHRHIHAYAHCPFCQAALAGGTIRRTREVIEVPRVPAVVTEHVYLERRCPACHRRCLPGPGLAGAVVGQGRFGVGLLALITWLREELRLPVAAVQRYLATVHDLALSVGAIVGASATVAAKAAPLVAQTQAAIRASPVVHADETGWREDGVNGYAWTFSTPSQRAFVHGGRDKGVLAAALGEAFSGVLVSDF